MDSGQPDIRASDADRAAVTRILEDAVGQGMLSLDEYTERVDVVRGTLGKALGGASGGYVSARREIVELLKQRARPYLF